MVGLLAACDPPPCINVQETALSLKNPQYVGTTEDGISIKRYKIINDRDYDHYVYVAGTKNITINQSVPSGKTTRIQVIFLYDGSPINKEKVKQLLEDNK